MVKDAAFTAVTSGFKVGDVQFGGVNDFAKQSLNIPTMYDPVTGARTAGYLSGTWAQNAAIDATGNALTQTGFYGGSLSDKLAQSWQTALVNEGTGFAQNFVGDIKGPDGSAIGIIGHGVTGCLSSDLQGGNCGQGAVSAAGAELATAWTDDAYRGDRDKVKALIGKTVNPTLAALTSGGDLGQFSINQGINASQLQNNYLKHTERFNFLSELSQCNGDKACIDEIAADYAKISDENNAELAKALEDGDLDKIEKIRTQIPTDTLEFQTTVFAYLKDDPVAASKFADVLNEGAVINVNENLVTASDATFYALRDGYYDNGDVESIAALGVSEFGPMGITPNLAGLLGARGRLGVGKVSVVPEVPGSYKFKFESPEMLANGRVLKGAHNPKVAEAAARGRQVHKEWNFGPGVEKEFRLPSGKRADAVNWKNHEVIELKPNNTRAIRRGEKQVESYRKELEDITGVCWTCRVETYD